MIYEIVNPSDAVTLEADDLAVAQAACILLGRGAYALTDEQGEEAMPLLLFDTYDAWAARTGYDLAAAMRDKRAAVQACLRSAMCCGIRDRAAIRAAVGEDPVARARYNDEKRTSLNDICGRAIEIADMLDREMPRSGGRRA